MEIDAPDGDWWQLHQNSMGYIFLMIWSGTHYLPVIKDDGTPVNFYPEYQNAARRGRTQAFFQKIFEAGQ